MKKLYKNLISIYFFTLSIEKPTRQCRHYISDFLIPHFSCNICYLPQLDAVRPIIVFAFGFQKNNPNRCHFDKLFDSGRRKYCVWAFNNSSCFMAVMDNCLLVIDCRPVSEERVLVLLVVGILLVTNLRTVHQQKVGRRVEKLAAVTWSPRGL